MGREHQNSRMQVPFISSLVAKIQAFGLATEYKRRTETGKWLGNSFGLLFLDPGEVSNSFVFELLSIRLKNDLLVEFSNYLIKTYVSEAATYPLRMRASRLSSYALTTNACE